MNKNKIYILFILTFHVSLLTFHLDAQVQQEWVRRYPDTNSFSAYSYALALDDSNNVYVTGTAMDLSTYCTIKYSPTGTQQWVAIYYGSNQGGRQADAIAIDKFSNVYVTGGSYNDTSLFDYCTIKYNLNGIQQWVQYYDGPAHAIDAARKIAIDKAGNIYVTGESSLGGYYFIYTTIKYSSDGRQLWVRNYGIGGGNTYANAIAIDDSCNIYISGENNSVSTTYSNAVTIKYDSSGNQLWVRTYSGLGVGGETGANSIALDKYNNVYITGFSQGLITWYDFFTIKYSSSGVQQWVRRYNADSTSYSTFIANSVAVDSTGNVYVSGFSNQIAPMKICLLKYTNSGVLIWVRRAFDTLTAQSTYMAIDNYSNIYIASSRVLTYSTYAMEKYDSSGVLKWQVFESPPFVGYVYGIILDNRNNVIVTGYSAGPYGQHNDMCTIKYSQLVGIPSENMNITTRFKLYPNYPNPFNLETNIAYELPVTSNVKLVIYDVLGRELITLIDEKQSVGSHKVEFDGSSFPSGVYFYRLKTDSFVETRKMILVK